MRLAWGTIGVGEHTPNAGPTIFERPLKCQSRHCVHRIDHRVLAERGRRCQPRHCVLRIDHRVLAERGQRQPHRARHHSTRGHPRPYAHCFATSAKRAIAPNPYRRARCQFIGGPGRACPNAAVQRVGCSAAMPCTRQDPVFFDCTCACAAAALPAALAAWRTWLAGGRARAALLAHRVLPNGDGELACLVETAAPVRTNRVKQQLASALTAIPAQVAVVAVSHVSELPALAALVHDSHDAHEWHGGMDASTLSACMQRRRALILAEHGRLAEATLRHDGMRAAMQAAGLQLPPCDEAAAAPRPGRRNPQCWCISVRMPAPHAAGFAAVQRWMWEHCECGAAARHGDVVRLVVCTRAPTRRHDLVRRATALGTVVTAVPLDGGAYDTCSGAVWLLMQLAERAAALQGSRADATYVWRWAPRELQAGHALWRARLAATARTADTAPASDSAAHTPLASDGAAADGAPPDSEQLVRDAFAALWPALDAAGAGAGAAAAAPAGQRAVLDDRAAARLAPLGSWTQPLEASRQCIHAGSVCQDGAMHVLSAASAVPVEEVRAAALRRLLQAPDDRAAQHAMAGHDGVRLVPCMTLLKRGANHDAYKAGVALPGRAPQLLPRCEDVPPPPTRTRKRKRRRADSWGSDDVVDDAVQSARTEAGGGPEQPAQPSIAWPVTDEALSVLAAHLDWAGALRCTVHAYAPPEGHHGGPTFDGPAALQGAALQRAALQGAAAAATDTGAGVAGADSVGGCDKCACAPVAAAAVRDAAVRAAAAPGAPPLALLAAAHPALCVYVAPILSALWRHEHWPEHVLAEAAAAAEAPSHTAAKEAGPFMWVQEGCTIDDLHHEDAADVRHAMDTYRALLRHHRAADRLQERQEAAHYAALGAGASAAADAALERVDWLACQGWRRDDFEAEDLERALGGGGLQGRDERGRFMPSSAGGDRRRLRRRFGLGVE
jgi:hypothetical protein